MVNFLPGTVTITMTTYNSNKQMACVPSIRKIFFFCRFWCDTSLDKISSDLESLLVEKVIKAVGISVVILLGCSYKKMAKETLPSVASMD